MTALDGTLLDIDGQPTLRFERRIVASSERVWRAVTDEEGMKAWFPSTVVGERRVGARLEFRDDPNLTGTTGHVTEWDPPRVFAFDWNGDQLRIEVTPDGDGTVLVFTHVLLDRSVAARNGSGWHMCLAALDSHLVGGANDVEWQEVYADYLDRMGPPLARREGDALVFERSHHVDGGDMRAAVDEWGEADGATFDIVSTDRGSTFRVTVPIADAEDAARWHAKLIELDMFAAAKLRIPVDPAPFVADYRRLLA